MGEFWRHLGGVGLRFKLARHRIDEMTPRDIAHAGGFARRHTLNFGQIVWDTAAAV